MQLVERKLEGGWIGVVSDTHVPARARNLPPGLIKILSGASLILHAGDLVEERIIHELEALAPVEAVAGNMDPYTLRRKLGIIKVVSLEKVKIGLVHGEYRNQELAEGTFREFLDAGVQAVVFGHSHQPCFKKKEGIYLINPGSPVDPRRGSLPSCAKVWIEGDSIKGEILSLP